MKAIELSKYGVISNFFCIITTLLAFCFKAPDALIVKTVGAGLFVAVFFFFWKSYTRIHATDFTTADTIVNGTQMADMMVRVLIALPPALCLLAVLELFLMDLEPAKVSWILVVQFAHISINSMNLYRYSTQAHQ